MLILTSGRLDRRLAGSRTGMTLVELLTVIAVISILIGILIPTVSTVRTSARKAKAKILLNQWAAGIETFRQEYGFYPAFDFDTEGLIASTADTDEFVQTLSGRDTEGVLGSFAGNDKQISFYTFSEGEISEADILVDVFGGTPIAIVVDTNYDGIIKIATGVDDDYTAFPNIGFGTGTPHRWPIDPDTGVALGLRAGVAIYSPGPGGSAGNIITTW